MPGTESTTSSCWRKTFLLTPWKLQTFCDEHLVDTAQLFTEFQNTSRKVSRPISDAICSHLLQPVQSFHMQFPVRKFIHLTAPARQLCAHFNSCMGFSWKHSKLQIYAPTAAECLCVWLEFTPNNFLSYVTEFSVIQHKLSWMHSTFRICATISPSTICWHSVTYTRYDFITVLPHDILVNAAQQLSPHVLQQTDKLSCASIVSLSHIYVLPEFTRKIASLKY